MQRRIQLILGAVIVAAILGAIAYKGIESTVAFYSPAEVLAAPDRFHNKTIRIMALVERNTTQWDADAVKLKFNITEDSQRFLPVEFRGVKPDMYREGQGIVVEGRLDRGGIFQASNLLVKHSEDYSVDESTKKKIQEKEAAYRALTKKQ